MTRAVRRQTGVWMSAAVIAGALAFAAGIVAQTPAKRWGTPEEIASAIVFLCSERASYVSGAAWSVDGGTVPVII